MLDNKTYKEIERALVIYENEYKGNCNVVTKHYSFNEGHGRQEEKN